MKKYIFILLFFLFTQLDAQLKITGITAASKQNVPPAGSTLLTGLTNYWKFDESAGTLVDQVGSATLTGTDLTYNQSGVVASAISFNGTTSKAVATIGLPTHTTTFSISFWIKTTSAATNQKWLYFYNGGGIVGYYDNGSFSITLADGVNDQEFSITGTYNDNVWHHFAISWSSAGSIICYVDNVSRLSNTWAYSLNFASVEDLTFMSTNYGSGYLAGLMDEIAIYNKAISTVEIAELNNSGNGKTYPF